MKLKHAAFLLVGLGFGVLIVVGALIYQENAGGDDKANRPLPPMVGSAVPDFELNSTDGAVQTLSSYRGKRLVINFWATWCGPCKEEMPLLEQYGKKYAGEMVILGVDSGESLEVVRLFIRETGITFPILLDQDGRVSDRYFVKDFPYTFFVDESGILRGQHIGLLSEQRLVQYLKTIGIE